MARARRRIPAWLQMWWLWLALLFLLTVASFWSSFFSALGSSEPAIVVHGIGATAWMLLAVVQAALIRRRRRHVHRLLGYGSLALAALVVASGVQMLRQMVFRDGLGPAETPLLSIKFFYVDLTALALFCLFIVLAIRAARHLDIPLHLRLVVATAILPLEAALERTFIYGTPWLVTDWNTALHASHYALIALTGAVTISEVYFRRLRWPMPLLLAYYLFNLATTDAVAQAPAFQAFAFAFSGR